MPSLPLFPLPTVVLFPNVFLPLHIFEPRYRQMIGDALAGDRIIGMALLRPGYQANYEGTPPVYATGCSGLITHVERLDDGKYNLVLRGLEKFTIEREEPPDGERLYRRAIVTPMDDESGDAGRLALREERKKLQRLLTPLLNESLAQYLPEKMPDEDLVNALAQYLAFEPLERLALLERHGALARCRSMVELLEMKALASGGEPGMIH